MVQIYRGIMYHSDRIAVVIPCYKVTKHIASVIDSIPDLVDSIVCVDDCCPVKSGEFIKKNVKNDKVTVIFNEQNKGVGGAVMHGYQYILDNDIADIVVKIDGDGQMDPKLISKFIDPIVFGRADYTKGNRFFNPEDVMVMPKVRLIGNIGLSFLSKFSSGYWNIFDPTNGYVAISSYALSLLPLSKIHNRFFFESDLLFRLHLVRAKVEDIPMKACYADEVSNLNVFHSLATFGFLHLRNLFKRIIYDYYLRELSIGSLALPSGFLLFIFGLIFGLVSWISNYGNPNPTPTGTVMLSVLPIILGFQLLLTFIWCDMSNTPIETITMKETPKKD